MDIALEERKSRKGLNLLRREKFIPAVVYGKDGKSVCVKLEERVFQEHMRKINQGALATARFKLTLNGESFIAYVKDISYHRVSYNIEHIDFMRVEEEDRITVHVPVVLKGVESCKGITQGGKLKKVKRSVKVNCQVKELPENFIVDVKNLALGEQIRVSDVKLTSSMRLKIHEKQVLISVKK
jgi:large subunit ribosomal protein L25